MTKAKILSEEISNLGGKLIAVSKTFSHEKIQEVYEQGVYDFGENYLNEAVEKIEALKDLSIKWHYVGRIQKGTINKLINKFDLIHTVAKLSHLEIINKKTEQKQKVLIQIRHPNDERDYGVLEKDLPSFIRESTEMEKIELSGLMFLPPSDLSGLELEKAFLWAKALFDRIGKEVLSSDQQKLWKVLSMGMSGDYETALKCGSTHVRLGRAVFGERP